MPTFVTLVESLLSFTNSRQWNVQRIFGHNDAFSRVGRLIQPKAMQKWHHVVIHSQNNFCFFRKLLCLKSYGDYFRDERRFLTWSPDVALNAIHTQNIISFESGFQKRGRGYSTELSRDENFGRSRIDIGFYHHRRRKSKPFIPSTYYSAEEILSKKTYLWSKLLASLD